MRRDYSDTTVIVPTMNEGLSIAKLIALLTRRYRGISIIVSDDGSTDGTQRAVALAHARNRNVRLLDRDARREHGLAASVMEAAMAARTPKIVVMDADMQHPVKKVGEISDKLSRYDIVVAVRTFVKDWGEHRRIISKGMAYISYATFLLRGRKTCNDMMSGFFGIRTALFRDTIRVHRNGFVGKGYKVLLDILRLVGKNATLGEVYYTTFHKRQFGKSKMGYRHIIYTVVSTFR